MSRNLAAHRQKQMQATCTMCPFAPCLASAAANAIDCSAPTLLANRAAAGRPCLDSAAHNTLSAAGPADSTLYAASAWAPEVANLAAPAPILVWAAPPSPAADSVEDDALSSNSPASIFASTAAVNNSSASLVQCSFDADSRLTSAAAHASAAVLWSFVRHASAAATHSQPTQRQNRQFYDDDHT